MYGSNTVALNASMMAQKSVPQIDNSSDEAKIREQTDAFESIILKMLMDNAMKNQEDMFSDQKDPGDKIYKSMYREELAKASSGGFGFSQMLFDYLSEKR